MVDVVPSSPSSLSSDNTDSDTVNTSSAKIYFGQFQSPERKLAALVDSTSQPEPNLLNVTTPGRPSLRRSPRLSSPPVRNDEEIAVEQSEQEEGEGEDNPSSQSRAIEVHEGSWRDAPLPDFLRKDEPSSAIASRIMRAHDNPSPPPKALRRSSTPRRSSRLVTETPFPSVPSSAENSDSAVESLLQTRDEGGDTPTPPPFDLFDMSPLPTPTIQRQSSRSPTPRRPTSNSPAQIPHVDVEADLISFDRSVIITPTASTAEIHSPSPRHATQQTVDDLLFSSPLTPTASEVEPQLFDQVERQTYGADDLPNLQAQSRGHSPVSSPSTEIPIKEVGHSERIYPPVESLVVPQTPKSEPGHSKMNLNESQLAAETPVSHLPLPDPSSFPRRSPRLSTLPLPTPQPESRLSTPGRTPRASKTPNAEGSQSRKRRRDDVEKTHRKSLSPKKREWIADSDDSGIETEVCMSPSKKGPKDRKRMKKGTDIISDANEVRLAESLSPRSAQILTRLVSSDQLAPAHQIDVEMAEQSTPLRREAAALTANETSEPPVKASVPPSSVQRPPPGLFSSHTRTPTRGTSTSRSLFAPNSPAKLTLTPAPSNDPNRTPARRIPAKEANGMWGSNQPNGVCTLPNLTRPPVFSRPPPANDTNRSPARRVPASGTAPKISTLQSEGILTSQAAGGASRPKSSSAEPPQVESIPGETKSLSKSEPVKDSSTKSGLPAPSSKRVFIGPAQGSTAPGTTRPASKPGSRIPRPGATSKSTNAARSSKLPMPSARKPTSSNSLSSRLPSPTKAPLARVVRLHNASSSSSDDSGSIQAQAHGAGSSRPTLKAPMAKRKREVERPMMKMRQVIPGMYGGPVKTAALNTTKMVPAELDSPSSLVKPSVQPGPIKVREVIKGTLQDFELRESSSKSLEALSEARARELAELEKAKAEEEAQREPSPPAPSLEAFTFECPVAEPETRMEIDSEPVTADSLPPSSDNIEVEKASQPGETPPAGLNARRSMRPRRAMSTDVFGAISSVGQAAQNGPRRKPPSGAPRTKSLPPNLVFHTNGLALKTLTNNNTVRNQNYHAQLEMHIVRKAGARPESPTMKLRTILEKQKEDQDKMRAERAKRRRVGSGTDEGMDIDMDVSQGGDEQLLKHRRGPGDEEDYETPARPNDGRKAVKWDRGLEVSVFLDEIQVQPAKHRATRNTVTPHKGCLNIAPDRAPLDGLGNPLNADSPLKLEPEKVVVTKYVYDDDEEAVVLEPPPPKTTRSKAKKK